MHYRYFMMENLWEHWLWLRIIKRHFNTVKNGLKTASRSVHFHFLLKNRFLSRPRIFACHRACDVSGSQHHGGNLFISYCMDLYSFSCTLITGNVVSCVSIILGSYNHACCNQFYCCKAFWGKQINKIPDKNRNIWHLYSRVLVFGLEITNP